MIRANNRSPMTLDGTRTYVIGSTRPVVIDPGPADGTHLEQLLRLLGDVTPVAILLTHGHADHSGLAVSLAERTGAPILMGRGAARLPFDSARLAGYLGEGDAIDCDAGPLEVHETPGHAPEHLVFVFRGEGGVRLLFAGDLFLGVGDTTVVSHPEGSVADYLRSLEVVTRLRPAVIFPAHGPPLRHPTRVIARYRSHRLERIEQVRRARRARPEASVDQLVDLVYGAALDPALRPAAVGSVSAILRFLESSAEGESTGDAEHQSGGHTR